MGKLLDGTNLTLGTCYYPEHWDEAMWISPDTPKIETFNSGRCEKVCLTLCVLGIVFMGLVSCVYQYCVDSVGSSFFLALN